MAPIRQECQSARSAWVGYGAALAACLLGAGWQIATRSGVSTTLAPMDLALLRYAVPGLVLLPLWLRTGLVPRTLGRGTLLVIVLGAGLPFGLAGMEGARLAPVAHMGALLPGAMPLFVALLAYVLLRERLSAWRWSGFALIALGILAIAWPALAGLSASHWRGDLLFLAAALLWAFYTVAYKKSGLSPWQAAALINGWSMLAVLPLWLTSDSARLLEAPLADVATQVVWQGLLAGLTGIWIYGVAVAAIGASRAAAFGALVPLLVALGGWLLLGETVDGLTAAAILVTAIGVALSTGLFEGRPPRRALRPLDRRLG